MILKLLSVALGGSIGSVSRYLVYYYFEKQHSSLFPWATLIVNLLGSFLIGFLWGYFDKVYVPAGYRLMIFIGLLGSFTTYSTFAFDIFSLFREGEFKLLIVYLFGTNILAIGFVFAGYYFTRLF
jgi:CrcB protein